MGSSSAAAAAEASHLADQGANIWSNFLITHVTLSLKELLLELLT